MSSPEDLLKLVVRLVLVILVPALVAFGSYSLMRHFFFSPVDPTDNKTVLFQIPPKTTFQSICRDLEAQGLVRYSWSLDIISRLKRVDKKIRAGEYALNKAMSPTEVLQTLVDGKVFERKVTVREGASIWDIGPIIEQAGLLSKDEFNAALVNPQLIREAGIPEESGSFEGYLFPETYSFSRPVDPKYIIWRMLEEGQKKWPDDFTLRADDLKMTRHEILTLASIIEKESGTDVGEQAMISAVFHNRLKEGMKLQADPTVIYGIPNFNGNLTKIDLETPTPYNTYTNFGLPPGPICNPGATAIRAALYPAETTAKYFVGNGQGGHVFSDTLDEHNRAVRQYQLGRQ
ncbi:MAG: endolytic transglycosylase MltG [Deltaproteobacteria bacterium]|nr:endolytic transglycosylase MltG [Deltaproteobacteria bacterium]